MINMCCISSITGQINHDILCSNETIIFSKYCVVCCKIMMVCQQCLQYNLCKNATLLKTKNAFQDQLSLNAGQKYCRMLQREHSAILTTFIELPFVIKIFILSILECPFYAGLTVIENVFLFSQHKHMLRVL